MIIHIRKYEASSLFTRSYICFHTKEPLRKDEASYRPTGIFVFLQSKLRTYLFVLFGYFLFTIS